MGVVLAESELLLVVQHQIENVNEVVELKTFYRCKEKDKKLYSQMSSIYSQFIEEKKLKQCRHGWSTQSNESMNTSIAAYAPKSKTYSKTMSLTNRTCIAIGVKNLGIGSTLLRNRSQPNIYALVYHNVPSILS